MDETKGRADLEKRRKRLFVPGVLDALAIGAALGRLQRPGDDRDGSGTPVVVVGGGCYGSRAGGT